MRNIISKKDVEYVAKLSRLKLREDEIPKFTHQLNTIIEYIKKLNEVDTSKTEPTLQVLPLANVRRKDVQVPSSTVEDALRNAPDKERGYFKVPPIIE